jgi:3D (Asp-Asp-Asp) domain-containing protein/LysM repeat protein
MKKLVSTVAIGILAAGVTVSNVSAAEIEVHKGDTLWEIARSQNTTVEKLMDVNNLQTTIIHPNQILSIDEQYTVKQGDTLSGIAYKFGVKVEDIKGDNNLVSDLILIDQVLTIRGGHAGHQGPVTNTANNTATDEPTVEKPLTEPAVQDEPSVEATEEPGEQKEPSAEEPAEPAEQEESSAEEPAEPVEQEKSNVEEPADPAEQEESNVKEPEQPAEDVEEESKEPNEEKDESTNEDIKVTENEPAAAKTESAEEDGISEGRVINVTATAYTAKCDGCTGVTSEGVDLNANPNAKVIAVDPSVIPMGSKVFVEGYGYATAADQGSAIKVNKIDVHVPTKEEALSWGTKTVKVTIQN